jgi:hypothetical protein
MVILTPKHGIPACGRQVKFETISNGGNIEYETEE